MFIILSMMPSVILYIIICKRFKDEKGTAGLLVKLFFLGIVSALVAGGANILFEDVFFASFDHESVLYIIYSGFVFTALLEEGFKYLAMRMLTWKNAAFNKTRNAVTYAMSVALGFGFIENIVYLMFDATISKVIIRGLLGALGHMFDAAFMSYYYGQAKYHAACNDKAGAGQCIRKALLIPILFHGAFDVILLLSDYDFMLILFFVFYIVEIVFAVKFLKKSQKENMWIPAPVQYHANPYQANPYPADPAHVAENDPLSTDDTGR